jgi:predicted 3-demethylubiquinone-9 3-methyltransferase (glyoxalase superfamily)
MTDAATFLMFEKDAEEAVKFYTDTVRDAKLLSPMMFSLRDQKFYCYNGGPHFKFTEGISIYIECEDQEEVDYHWDKLVAGGGEHSQCGWLKDRFGLSWQAIPRRFMEMVQDPDREKVGRVMDAMLKMTKFEIDELEKVYAGK